MKFYLVFYRSDDDGNREDCNVYYSWLTQAASKQAAIKKVAEKEDLEVDGLDAQVMPLIQ